jgi:hypothetical protein
MCKTWQGNVCCVKKNILDLSLKDTDKRTKIKDIQNNSEFAPYFMILKNYYKFGSEGV